VQPATDHFEKLLEDYGMMKNFMASGSLTQGMELNEVPDEGDTTPFPGEDVVMTLYDGHPPLGMRRVSNPSPGTLAHYGWGCGDTSFLISLYINVYRYMDMYIIATPKAK
jgi:hypothetical protein